MTEGESVSITCTAKGFPYPQVTWLMLNKVAKYTGDASNITGESYEALPNVSSVLEIQDVVPELTGNYSCKASPSSYPRMPLINSTKVIIEVLVSGKLFDSNM